MHPLDPRIALAAQTRRTFLGSLAGGAAAFSLGGIALGELLAKDAPAASGGGVADPLAPRAPHFTPRAKRVIYIHLAGSPSQLELLDYKPKLAEFHGTPCPDEYLKGEKFAFIKGHPTLLAPQHKFQRTGRAGLWTSDLLPHFRTIEDEVCVINSMTTDQFNHAPAQLLLHTGESRFGAASFGAWVGYGLGCETRDLPSYVVLVSGDKTPDAGKSVWGSGFLPSVYQGVQCRASGDPVLYVKDPEGMLRETRRATIDAIADLGRAGFARHGDRETEARIAQYELAYRMQTAVPEAMDLTRESALRRARRASRTHACLRGAWSSAACASCSSTTGAGTATAPIRATTSSTSSPGSAARWTSLWLRSYEISAAADCSMTRSSSGAASSAARRSRSSATETRTSSAATTIRTPSRCGWRAAA